MEQTVKEVRNKDKIAFQCDLCGACCRDVEDKIMLEAYDAYRLGRYLRALGDVENIEDVYEKYASPVLLSEGFPVFTLRACGEDHHCIFLRDGRCSVYDARLRVCRIYPFAVGPGDHGRPFSCYQCMDCHARHFNTSRTVSVNDWMYENFPKPERTLFAKEMDTLPELGKRVRQLSAEQQEHFLFRMLYYRYYNFDLDRPFSEQYDHNQRELFRALDEVIRHTV